MSFSVEDELTVGELIIVFVVELVGRIELVEATKETKRELHYFRYLAIDKVCHFWLKILLSHGIFGDHFSDITLIQSNAGRYEDHQSSRKSFREG